MASNFRDFTNIWIFEIRFFFFKFIRSEFALDVCISEIFSEFFSLILFLLRDCFFDFFFRLLSVGERL